MSLPQLEFDLVCLTADKNMQQSLLGLLGRSQALKIRELRCDVLVHTERDPGCFNTAHNILRTFVARASHALVLFDHEGCGQEAKSPSDLEEDLRSRLDAAGWGERAAVVVIQPELEAWVWSDSPHVTAALGWEGRSPDLRSWLREKKWLEEGALKPSRPKEAVEQALRQVRKPPTSKRYRDLAQKVSFARCTDPAFSRLLTILRSWFGTQSS